MELFGINFSGVDCTRGNIKTTGNSGYTRGSGGVERTKFTQTEGVKKSGNKFAMFEQYDLKSPESRDAEHGQDIYCFG